MGPSRGHLNSTPRALTPVTPRVFCLPYPLSSRCEVPNEDPTNRGFCRPLPVDLFPIPILPEMPRESQSGPVLSISSCHSPKLTLSLVPGTLQWTKVKALPESAWAKQLPRSVKGKAGPQTTAQPNGRIIESKLAPRKRLNQALPFSLYQTSGDAPQHLETMASDRPSSQTKAELVPNPLERCLLILSSMAMAKGRRGRGTRRPPIWTNS